MAIPRPNFSIGRVSDPIADLGSSLGSFSQRLLDRESKNAASARSDRQLQLQEGRYAAASARSDRQLQLQEGRYAAANERSNRQLELQEGRYAIAQQEAKRKADEAAGNRQYSALLGQGPQDKYQQGLITDAYRGTDTIDQMQLTPAELAETRAGNISPTTQAKLDAQSNFGTQATGLLGDPSLRETRAEQLGRVNRELGASGYTVPQKALDTYNNALLAETSATKSSKDALKKSDTAIGKRQNAIALSMAREMQKSGAKASITPDNTRAGRIKLTGSVDKLVKDQGISRGKTANLVKKAEDAYDVLVTKEGIHPDVATNILERSMRVNNGWFSDTAKVSQPIMQDLALRAKASEAKIAGDTTNNPVLQQLASEQGQLLASKEANASSSAALDLTPAQRRQEQVLQNLGVATAPAQPATPTPAPTSTPAAPVTDRVVGTGATDNATQYGVKTLENEGTTQDRVADIKNLSDSDLVVTNPKTGETRTYTKGEVPANMQGNIISPDDYIKRYGGTGGKQEVTVKEVKDMEAKGQFPLYTPDNSTFLKVGNKDVGKQYSDYLSNMVKDFGKGNPIKALDAEIKNIMYGDGSGGIDIERLKNSRTNFLKSVPEGQTLANLITGNDQIADSEVERQATTALTILAKPSSEHSNAEKRWVKGMSKTPNGRKLLADYKGILTD